LNLSNTRESCLNVLHLRQLTLHDATITTIVAIAPSHDRIIFEECSKSILRRPNLLNLGSCDSCDGDQACGKKLLVTPQMSSLPVCCQQNPLAKETGENIRVCVCVRLEFSTRATLMHARTRRVRNCCNRPTSNTSLFHLEQDRYAPTTLRSDENARRNLQCSNIFFLRPTTTHGPS